MNTIETAAVLDDASHLTLRDPLPLPAGREYKVVVHVPEDDQKGKSSPEWIAKFLAEIRIDDPKFERPPQGDLPPIHGLNT